MVQQKSTGLKFAEEQLLRYGWEKGKGLGRSENGISEAIKVSMKRDTRGVGHKQGEQFSFRWWDHVFNKASSSLVVESGQISNMKRNGVEVKKSDDSSEFLISNKKPRKAQQAKFKLYGSFVKSATLLSGEKLEKISDSDDSSSNSEDEDQKLDLSSTTKLSDADLLKACGGRTAHKGARHGLTMSAKLARLEQQEQEFIKKYEDGKPKKRKDFNGASMTDMITDIEPKKKKKKRNRKQKEAPEDCVNGECSIDAIEEFTRTHLPMDDSTGKKKKKKKKRSELVAETADANEISEDSIDGHSKQPQEGSTEYQQTSDNASKRKKKKKM
ncbi:hypothetical protein Q8A67_007662 [Cirrhinus molitorella]|uniref:G patch domain-containing protein 4 n=1 Tax=Cirrhinus molitorella TaxID=172907 RepID=A0AA88TR05_9TELE|nr:hypothetical protein Q8A67_007662 [Cirrhinus molitorella]